MKKYFLALLTLCMLIFVGCENQNDTLSSSDSGLPTNDSNLSIITGKIIEIKDNNVILIEVTKERGNYKKEEKVLIKFNNYYLSDALDSEAKITAITPSLNDEVSTNFWPSEVKQEDGYDLITTSEVIKFINL